MAFNPNSVTYPTPNLQHMFTRHKADWGYAGQNWNNTTRDQFTQTLRNFIANIQTVHAGTYRQNPAWLVIEQNAPYKCAIIYRPGYQIWSGWNLSPAQFNHANNPPYALGGGALVIFGDILEEILVAKDHESVDRLAQKFLDTYKEHASERYPEGSEKTLMDLFAVMDNYAPPDMAEQMSGSGQISDLDEVKKFAQKTLAILEKHSDS
ncbi:hypothetical protein ACMFMG_011268 [Clarireedia jacksonii]